MTTDKSLVPLYSEVATDDTFVHYYDLHPTKEDLMGESPLQATLIAYLIQVLDWLYRAEGWFVINNINIYQHRRLYEQPLAPDVAVFKGVVKPNLKNRKMHSWRLYEPNRPAPQVVFEISSGATWQEDLDKKPERYAEIGVREYYAYDPNDPPYWPSGMGRLRGWWNEGGRMVEQPLDQQGRVWSAELESWLAPDGEFLRLFDREGQQRLTGQEAERAAKETSWQAEAAQRAATEAERAAKEAERAAKEAERAAKEAERAAKEAALAEKEAERAAKEAALAEKEAAWAKLRELGIDPTQL